MDKVVVVVGASSGFGKEIFNYLKDKGFKTIGLARSFSDSEELSTFHLDVSNPEEVKRVLSKIIKNYGSIDVLINVAGFGIAGSVEDTPIEAIKKEMDVNFFGIVYTTKEVLSHMRKKRSGTIINFSSIASIIALPYQAFYSASKFAVEGFSEALAIEVEPFNINVVLIEPGDFKTGFTSKREKYTKEDSPYHAKFNSAISKMEKDEQNGENPAIVATLIYKIITSPKPRRKYIIGPFFEKLFVFLKRILPDSVITFIFKLYYGL
ncbi:MAG: SDR family oxidoreductase [Caldisericaceae bacterium]